MKWENQNYCSGLTGVLYILDEPSIGLHLKQENKFVGIRKILYDIEKDLEQGLITKKKLEEFLGIKRVKKVESKKEEEKKEKMKVTKMKKKIIKIIIKKEKKKI